MDLTDSWFYLPIIQIWHFMMENYMVEDVKCYDTFCQFMIHFQTSLPVLRKISFIIITIDSVSLFMYRK